MAPVDICIFRRVYAVEKIAGGRRSMSAPYSLFQTVPNADRRQPPAFLGSFFGSAERRAYIVLNFKYIYLTKMYSSITDQLHTVSIINFQWSIKINDLKVLLSHKLL